MSSSLAPILLAALFCDLPHKNHVLTLNAGRARSTAVERREDGFEVELPAVVERLCAALAHGELASVVLRSFTDERSEERRVGEEWRTRWQTCKYTNKKDKHKPAEHQN